LLFLFASGCSFGPTYKEPSNAAPASFVHSGAALLESTETVERWWTLFNDADLNRYIGLASQHNHTVEAARAGLAEARALRTVSKLDLFPIIRSGNSFTKSERSRVVGTNLPFIPRWDETFDAGLEASWELDFFGRNRRGVEAATAAVGGAEAQVRDALVLVTAELARSYFELRGLQNQHSVARKNAENQRETLKLTRSLLEGGRGTELDVQRATAQLNQTLASIPLLEAGIDEAAHRISVLTGKPPGSLLAELRKQRPIPTTRRSVKVGTPEALLRRRPDVRVAERDLAAATANIGVITADLFPRVTFNGSLGLAASHFGDLTNRGAGRYAFGPSISWAAFDLGRVQAQIKAADARANAALAQYQQTVLNALEETENALTYFNRQKERRDYLRQAAEASARAAALARERYVGGASDFLTVLDAERVMLAAQATLAESETFTATALVAVYKALGGGWGPAPTPDKRKS
jgi:multidrug efflux system outer membrane protein